MKQQRGGTRKVKSHKTKGQVLLETIWLVLFAFAFLTMLSHLYKEGKKEIEMIRIKQSQPRSK